MALELLYILQTSGSSICIQLKKGKVMSVISILLALVIAGVVLWLVNTYIPMDRKIKTILNVVVVVIVIIWLLSAFGILGTHTNMRIGNTPL